MAVIAEHRSAGHAPAASKLPNGRNRHAERDERKAIAERTNRPYRAQPAQLVADQITETALIDAGLDLMSDSTVRSPIRRVSSPNR